MTMYHAINSILIGESGAGKTSLLSRFKSGTFNAYQTTAAAAVNYYLKTTNVRGKDVRHSIWDLSGKEEHRSVIMGYYEKADGVLLIYDVRKLNSFETLYGWITLFRSINRDAEIIIVGNKSENLENKFVDTSSLRKFAREQSLSFAEVSAKSGENVSEVFSYLTERILFHKKLLHPRDNHSSLELEMTPKRVSSSIAITNQPNKDDINSSYNSNVPPETTEVSQEYLLPKTAVDETIESRQPDNYFESCELASSYNMKKYDSIVPCAEESKEKCCVIV